MSQEFVWPLALCFDTEFQSDLTEEQNATSGYYQNEVIKEWVEAGIMFAAKSAHADGSCDDYFPFERAGGAAAFSLLAFAESFRLLTLEAGGLSVTCVDLTPAFRDRSRSVDTYFHRNPHWNREGHRLAAEEIVRYLR